MSTLPLSTVVSVTVELSATPPAAPSLSGILVLGSATKLSLAERVKQFTKDTYAGMFAVGDPEYRALAKGFMQNPQPDVIYAGRRFGAAQAGVLAGAPAATLTTLKLITAGEFAVTIDATACSITALDLSGAADMAAVAALIQVKLRAAMSAAAVLCAVDSAGTGFNITSATTGTTSQVSYVTGHGTDVTTCDTLGLSATEGARRTVGIATESTVTDSLNAALKFSAAWFSFCLSDEASLADQTAAADWAEAHQRPFYVATSNPASFAAPSSPDTDTDIAGYAMRKGYAFTIVIYTTDDVNAAVSADARMSTVDYLQPNSVISLWGKQLPGVSTEDIDTGTLAALGVKNCNVYANVGGFNMVTPGKTAGGRFLDEVLGINCWLKNQLMSEIFAALVAFPQGIAQTDEDVYKLVLAAESALRKGVVNKLLAPRVWPTDADQVGTVKPGDYLKDGYYVVAAAVSSQSDADRAARLAPPITAIATGAGRVQAVKFNLIFSR